jgi:hypothetical protein
MVPIRSKEENRRMHDLQSDLLRQIRLLRQLHPDLLDVTFVVGREDDDGGRKEFCGNSTVLSLRSPYFKAMCFGPMKQPDKKKVITDVSPDVFEKLLDYLHAADGCLDLESLEQAWNLRYAATQFLIPDLVEVCDAYIRKRLTFRNGLVLLEQATAFRADDFKRQLYRVIKNRHAHILTSEDLSALAVGDLVELIKLYRGVKTDFVVRAIHIWGRSMDGDEFKTVFRDVLYKHIAWDNLSNQAMVDLHKTGTLPMTMENEAMLAILSRTYPLPKEEAETVCTIDLRVSMPEQSTCEFRPQIGRLLLRTTKALQGRNSPNS